MRFHRRDEMTEEPCPRCGIPAPTGAATCSACGWDLNESYHADFVGSRVGSDSDDTADSEQAHRIH